MNCISLYETAVPTLFFHKYVPSESDEADERWQHLLNDNNTSENENNNHFKTESRHER